MLRRRAPILTLIATVVVCAGSGAAAAKAPSNTVVLLIDNGTPAAKSAAVRDGIAAWLGPDGRVLDPPETLGGSAAKARSCVSDAPCLRRLAPAGTRDALFLVVESPARALAVESFELPSGRPLGGTFVETVDDIAKELNKLGSTEPLRLLVRVPKGAALSVNGFAVGDTGAALPPLVPGSYELEAEADGSASVVTVPLSARLAVVEVSVDAGASAKRKRRTAGIVAGVVVGVVVLAGAGVLTGVLLTRPDPPPATDLGDFRVF